MTAERAAIVRSWRIRENMTWRQIAGAWSESYGPDHDSNQLYGMDICNAAQEFLGEQDNEEWN